MLLFPPDDPSPQESLREPSAKEQKRKLREQERKFRAQERDFRAHERKLHERDWLAPAGSVQERQFLERMATREGSGREDIKLISQWIDNPDEFAKHNALYQQTAKKHFLGPLVNETARERHRTLDNEEWLVACFTSQGMRQKRIATLIHVSDKTVDNIILSLKKKIGQKLKYDIEVNDRIQIARWFLGL